MAAQGAACYACRLSHTACLGGRPCSRCKTLGFACQPATDFIPPRKRGRPPKKQKSTTEQQPVPKRSKTTTTTKAIKQKPSGGGGSGGSPIYVTNKVNFSISAHASSPSIGPIPHVHNIQGKSVAHDGGNPEELAGVPRAELPPSNDDAGTNNLASSLLLDLVKEMRELKNEMKNSKQETNKILNELASLNRKVNQQRHQNAQSLSHEDQTCFDNSQVNLSSPLVPQQQPQHCHDQQQNNVSLAIASINSNFGSSSMHIRQKCLDQFPFLSSYSAYLSDTKNPFVVDDINKPVAAFFAHIRIHWNGHPAPVVPPVLMHANEHFCKMLGYPKDELIGSPANKYMIKDVRVAYQLRHLIIRRSPVPASEVVTLNSLKGITGSGSLCLFNARVQIFYDHEGFAKWNICCVQSFRIVPLDPEIQQALAHHRAATDCAGQLLECVTAPFSPLGTKCEDYCHENSQPSSARGEGEYPTSTPAPTPMTSGLFHEPVDQWWNTVTSSPSSSKTMFTSSTEKRDNNNNNDMLSFGSSSSPSANNGGGCWKEGHHFYLNDDDDADENDGHLTPSSSATTTPASPSLLLASDLRMNGFVVGSPPPPPSWPSLHLL